MEDRLALFAVAVTILWAIGLSWYDVVFLRIPKVAVSTGVGCLLVVTLAALRPELGAIDSDALEAMLPWVVGGAGALFLGYATMRSVAPAHLGGGDVRLAAVVGGIGGIGGLPGIVFVAACPFAVTALLGMVLTRGRGGRHVPHGPGMAVCAAVEAGLVLVG